MCIRDRHTLIASIGKHQVDRAVLQRQIGAVTSQIYHIDKRISTLCGIKNLVPLQNPVADVHHDNRHRPVDPFNLLLDPHPLTTGHVQDHLGPLLLNRLPHNVGLAQAPSVIGISGPVMLAQIPLIVAKCKGPQFPRNFPGVEIQNAVNHRITMSAVACIGNGAVTNLFQL